MIVVVRPLFVGVKCVSFVVLCEYLYEVVKIRCERARRRVADPAD